MPYKLINTQPQHYKPRLNIKNSPLKAFVKRIFGLYARQFRYQGITNVFRGEFCGTSKRVLQMIGFLKSSSLRRGYPHTAKSILTWHSKPSSGLVYHIYFSNFYELSVGASNLAFGYIKSYLLLSDLNLAASELRKYRPKAAIQRIP